jgi:hypothetical protein
MYSKNKSSLI